MIKFVCFLFLITNVIAIGKPKQKPMSGEIDLSKMQIKEFSKFDKNHSQIRNGVVYTKGRGTKKYPPSLGIPIKETDCAITFKYRQLGDGKAIIFFINGDDSFGGFDHTFRIYLLRNGIKLQVDAHTKNKNELSEKQKQRNRPPNKTSGAYRNCEARPFKKVNLNDDKWHTVEIVFKGKNVKVSLDGKLVESLDRRGFAFEKNELYFMQDGGEKGLELGHFNIESLK